MLASNWVVQKDELIGNQNDLKYIYTRNFRTMHFSDHNETKGSYGSIRVGCFEALTDPFIHPETRQFLPPGRFAYVDEETFSIY